MTTSSSYASRTRASTDAAATASPIATLQRRCACGGGAGLSGKCENCEKEERFGSGLQTKLTVNSPGDRYEQEADRVADQVMGAPEADSAAPLISPLDRFGEKRQDGELRRQDMDEEEEEEVQAKPLQRQEAEEEEEEELQTKRLQRQEAVEEDEEELQAKSLSGPSRAAARPGFARMLEAEASSGEALAPQARAFLEPRFGRDLGDVRVHRGGRAAKLSREINARAFTHGRHVYFGAGQYDAASNEGRRLIAHELTHTFQQVPVPSDSIVRANAAAEFAAQPSGDVLADGRAPSPAPPISPLQREKRDNDQILQATPAAQAAGPAAATATAPFVCQRATCKCEGDLRTALDIAKISAVTTMRAAKMELDSFDTAPEGRKARKNRRKLKGVFGRSFGYKAFTSENVAMVRQRLEKASAHLDGLEINKHMLCDEGWSRTCQQPDVAAYYEPGSQRIIVCASSPNISNPAAVSVSDPARLAVAERERRVEEATTGGEAEAERLMEEISADQPETASPNQPAVGDAPSLDSAFEAGSEAKVPSEGELLRYYQDRRLQGRAELTRLMIHESIHHAIQPSITEIYESQALYGSIGGRSATATELAPAALQNAESYAHFVLDFVSTFDVEVRDGGIQLLPSEAATLLLPLAGQSRQALDIQIGPVVGRRKIRLAVQLGLQVIREAKKGLGILLARRRNSWSAYATEAEGLVTLLRETAGVAGLASPGPAAEAALVPIETALGSLAEQMGEKTISVRRRHRGEHDPEQEIRLTVEGGLAFNRLDRLAQVRELLSQILALDPAATGLAEALTEFSCQFGLLQGFGRCAAEASATTSSGQNTALQTKSRATGATPCAGSDFEERMNAETGGGSPLNPAHRAFFEPRFGRDFGDVRIHSDVRAAELSRDVAAHAFTHQRHIFFGSGRYDPVSTEGRRLLAHELTHTAQQSASGATPSLQRRNIFEEIAGLFRSDDIPDDELRGYLQSLVDNGRIEDFTDSDNKARAAVNRLRADQGLFGIELTLGLRKLLIQEMLSGFTGDDDEEAILHLMTSTDVRTVQSLFEGDNALEAESLLSAFQGPQRRSLLNLYAAIGVEVEDLERRENFEGCNDPEKESIQEGMNASRSDLRHAITFMEEHPDSPSISIAFWLAFRISEPDEDRKRETLEQLRSIREGVPRSHYICDHGEASESSCHDGALGHASLGPGGQGISLCFAPAGEEQENDYFSKDLSEQAEIITHEAAHFFLAVDDTGGYFGTECGETPIDTTCLEGTREDCGTSGRPPAERLDTADAYACFVHFLRLAAVEEGGEETLQTRFRESRGESLQIKAYVPEAILAEQLVDESIYVNSPEGSEHFALDGVPEASGFTYEWTVEVGGRSFRLRADEYLRRPGAVVPEEVKADLREIVAASVGQAEEGAEAAPPPRVEGAVVCRVHLFTGAPESDQVQKRLVVRLRTEPPELGL